MCWNVSKSCYWRRSRGCYSQMFFREIKENHNPLNCNHVSAPQKIKFHHYTRSAWVLNKCSNMLGLSCMSAIPILLFPKTFHIHTHRAELNQTVWRSAITHVCSSSSADNTCDPLFNAPLHLLQVVAAWWYWWCECGETQQYETTYWSVLEEPISDSF